MIRILFLLIFIFKVQSQTFNLNNTYFENKLRLSQINGELDSDISFMIRPLHQNVKENVSINGYSKNILNFFGKKGRIDLLPIDYNISYNSHHPYNRNNGSMIPSKGFQHMISAGFFMEIGPLSIQLKPEHIYSENLNYDGFWEGHWDIIWSHRYILWNRIDMPERFGNSKYSKNTLGQSSIRLNYKSISLGLSSENVWWGPSFRNSIMLSNHAQGFNHITLNTRYPIKTKIGNFEFQFVTGKLLPSGFDPPNTERTYSGTKLFVSKINQLGETNDWRFFQGYNFVYNPKWINGLYFGISRWTQMYGSMFENKYWWIQDANNGAQIGWFPIFNNFLRKNDKIEPYEKETDQAASLYFRWIWKDSKAEIYGEFAYNDSKFNLRDLLLDSDHARAVTLGVNKLFKKKNDSQLQFRWEWTQMEQTASRLIRNAGSWYMHNRVRHGYTNNGEVMGSGIGPGSNSQYFNLNRIKENSQIGLALEIIDNDNDFYYLAWEDNGDFRRYWKAYNFHLNYDINFKKIWASINLIYIRSLNYQWELSRQEEGVDNDWYRPGKDVNNFHLNLKLTYKILN